MLLRLTLPILLSFFIHSTTQGNSEVLQIAYFETDVSPPIGSPLYYNPNDEVLMPLSARGVVLLSKDRPIVICAVDWIGIGNGGYTEWQSELAKAADTVTDRVAVHTLHQHDAPGCDFTSESILAAVGLEGRQYDAHFARMTISRVATAVRKAIQEPQTVTHVGVGVGIVEKIASNRRVIGDDGKIKYWRASSTSNIDARAEPEGIIDPLVRSVSFFQDEKPLVVLCYYATHPMSYYGTGKANPDFVGIARTMREDSLGVPHIYFTGAAGNVAAGKYNDGAHENRQIFADRLAAGMAAAWKKTKKKPISSDNVSWQSESVVLPLSPNLIEPEILQILQDDAAPSIHRFKAARNLAWLRRCRAKDTVLLSCLHLGDVRLLHLCGELFIEYQLAAQARNSDCFVAVAAYGDYGPGYIGLEASYARGGYEVRQGVSRVAPEAEQILMPTIERLLQESPK